MWPTHCLMLPDQHTEHERLDEEKPLWQVRLFPCWGFHLFSLVLKGCGKHASWIFEDNGTLPLWRANNSLKIRSLMTRRGFLQCRIACVLCCQALHVEELPSWLITCSLDMRCQKPPPSQCSGGELYIPVPRKMTAGGREDDQDQRWVDTLRH